MAYLTYRGTLYDGILASPATVARLDAGAGGGATSLVLTDNGAGYRVEFSLKGGALAVVADADPYLPGLPEAFQVLLGDQTIALGRDDIAAVAAMAESDSQTIYAARSGQQADRIEALAVRQGLQTYVYLAESDGAGLFVYRLRADGTLAPVAVQPDDGESHARAVTSMASVTIGGQSYLIAASATENGLTSYRVAGDGSLQPVQALGPDELLPVASPQALEAVRIGGSDYAILASAGTSSLTVLRITADGTMTPVDQVLDDLETRFAGATVLESFTLDGRVFVLAAGGDDGLSLFTLLPDGRLLHLETVADIAFSSLANITDIALRIVGGEVQLFVISGADAGMTQFTLDPGPAGVILAGAGPDITGTAANDILSAGSTGVQLGGGPGDDILIDGAGQDMLTGGAGADYFVFAPDGQNDTVTDFTPGVDRLDLSAFGMIYDISAIAITETATGAILTVNGESVELISASGSTIAADSLTTGDVVNITRVSLTPQSSPEDPVIEGGRDDDIIIGGSADQALYGRDGDDVMTGGDGADFLHGGDGTDIADYSDAPAGVTVSLSDPAANTGFAAGDTYLYVEGISGSAFGDTLCGDNLNNVLIGAGGDDLLCGEDGDDRIEGNAGRDRLEGGAGNDVLIAGDGNDELLGQAGDDTLEGGAGNDNISAADGNDMLDGGEGHDQLGGGDGDDVIYGGAGNDTIGAGSGNDFIDGGAGSDVISGGYGADLEFGGTGDDTMAGSYGNDIVYGGAGNDSLGGGTGKDALYAGDGDDQIGAGSFDDMAWGGAGNDFIAGGDGDDQLWGEDGNDTLNGGAGDDALSGGADADIFVFNEFAAGEVDTIRDFEDGLDLVRLKGVAGGFAALQITEVTAGAETYVEVEIAGHVIRLGGIAIADIGAEDFLFI